MKKLFAICFALSLAACASSDGEGPSGATCPTANPPTYANFGKAFFDSTCIACHSNYQTEAGIKADAAQIDIEAGKGPTATNVAMPPRAPGPSDADREKLGQFMACLQK
jgi:cytochrome c5